MNRTMSEFNLLDEPWIKVIEEDCTEREVSILELIKNAHNYVKLCGTSDLEDFTVIRFILAITNTVIERYSVNGEEKYEENQKSILERWNSYWELGKFPYEIFSNYLEEYRDRFYLFDEEKPFYQFIHPELMEEKHNYTEYSGYKLNGKLLESSSKKKFYKQAYGETAGELSFAEAARALLYVNGFDDASCKAKYVPFTQEFKKEPKFGYGYLAKIGAIMIDSDNLFETLMLNTVLLKDGDEMWEEKNLPIWEKDPDFGFRNKIDLPLNQASILTLQSRRFNLIRKGNKVVGYRTYYGDIFDLENAFTEQMTQWITTKNEKGFVYIPKFNITGESVWRDFGGVFCPESDQHSPGIVSWYKRLCKFEKWKYDGISKFTKFSVRYDSQGMSVIDMTKSSVLMHKNILKDISKPFLTRINKEISKSLKIAEIIYEYETNLLYASGRKERDLYRNMFYDEAGEFILKWIYGIDSENDSIEEKCNEFDENIKRVARRIQGYAVEEIGMSAFIGKTVIIKEKSKTSKKSIEVKKHFSLPEADIIFDRKLWEALEK